MQFLFTIYLRQTPKGFTASNSFWRRITRHAKDHARNSFGLLPQGYCVQKPLNLEIRHLVFYLHCYSSMFLVLSYNR